MKGHIKRRSKGSRTIWVDVGRDPETRKRKQQTLTVRGSKKDAERELRAVLTRAVNTRPRTYEGIASERLGHSSVAITLDIYSHILPGLQ